MPDRALRVLATEETLEGTLRIISFITKGRTPVVERCSHCMNTYDRKVKYYSEAWVSLNGGEVEYYERILVRDSHLGKCPECKNRTIFRVSRMPERYGTGQSGTG